MSTILKVEDLTKSYFSGKNENCVIKGVSFEVEEGEFALLTGDSGSGKSTILNIVGGMDRATSGRVFVLGGNICDYNEKQLNEYRRGTVGFVFQRYNLINNLSALENILLVNGNNVDSAKNLLVEMGLESRMNAFPNELSGGEAQRVALARAMSKSPSVLLCDEPTGALDYENSLKVMAAIVELNKKEGITVLMVTHNPAFVPLADKVIRLKSGWIESITVNEDPLAISELKW